MTPTQKEALLSAAILIQAATSVIELIIRSNNDLEAVEMLETTVCSLGYRIDDVKEVLTELKQANP